MYIIKSAFHYYIMFSYLFILFGHIKLHEVQ